MAHTLKTFIFNPNKKSAADNIFLHINILKILSIFIMAMFKSPFL